MIRILVLGAGTGGTLVANMLADRLHDEILNGRAAVQLVGEGRNHIFQPANLDVAFKGSNPEEGIREEATMLGRHVDYIQEPAVKVDLAERYVVISSGNRIDYDYLVLATGSVADPSLMPGLREGSLNFHTGPYDAARIWDALQRFKEGRVLVAIAGLPHKCPPSPNEAAFMLDEFFRRRGLRKSVEIRFLTPYPRAYPAETISKVIQPLFEERRIEVLPFFNADYVDPTARKIYSLEGEAFAYDLLIAIPPHQGARVVRVSEIGDRDGWIPTDRRTMNVKGHSEVFALGDATDIPISKSGVVAHLQSLVVVENLLSDIHGTEHKLEYNGRINCPMEVGNGRAIFVSATYSSPLVDQTPSFTKYLMKRSFSKLYWSTLRGRWEWLFHLYFGETSSRLREPVLGQEIEGRTTATAVA